MPNVSDKAAAFHPHKHRTKAIDYSEAVFLLNMEENTPLCSRV